MNQNKEDSNATSRPRGRKRRVLLAIFLICVVGPIVAHWLWRNVERRKLDALLAQHRAAGEPVSVQDLNGPAVDAPDNPVPELREAAKALTPNFENWLSKDEAVLPLTNAEAATLHAVVQENQAALEHVDAAFVKGGRAEWSIALTSPLIDVLLPDLSLQRHLAHLLRTAAMDAHHQGDDAEAMRRVRQLFFVHRALGSHPTLVGHLVYIGVGALTSETVIALAPDLQIAGNANGAAGAADGHPHAATREQVQRLISDLLDEGPLRADQRLGFLSERVFEVDCCDQIAMGQFRVMGSAQQGPSSSSFGGYVVSPLAYRDARILIRALDGVQQAAGAADWPGAQARLATVPEFSLTHQNMHPFVSVLLPAWNRAVEQDYRFRTEARLSASALALREYAADHDGKLPATLQDLVPVYLPAVPLDPMSSGAPLRFKPMAANPILYSVGENNKDDGGSEASPDQRPASFWHAKDMVVHLTRQPRQSQDNRDSAAAKSAPNVPK